MRNITLFILLAISLFSCTKENLDMCQTGIPVSFSYTLNEAERDLFYDEVQRIDLLAFDQQGLLVGVWSDEGKPFPDNYAMNISLPSGQYKLVAWGGKKTCYNFENIEVGVTTFDQARLALIADQGHTVTTRPEALYFGTKADITVIDNTAEPINISFIKNTNNIRVTIKDLTDKKRNTGIGARGKQELPDLETLSAEIISRNGKYHFDNSVDLSAEQHIYKQYNRSLDGNCLQLDYTTLRLLEHNPATLKLHNTTDGTTLFSCSLVEQIIAQHPLVAQNPTLGLDKYSDYLIEMEYADLEYAIYVTVNGWRVRLLDVSLD